MDTLQTYGAIIHFVEFAPADSGPEYLRKVADAFNKLAVKLEHFGVTQRDIEHISIGPEEPFGDRKSVCITVELRRDVAHPEQLSQVVEEQATTLGLTYQP